MHNIADISLETMQIKRQSTISLNDLGGIMNYLILYTTKIFLLLTFGNIIMICIGEFSFVCFAWYLLSFVNQ